MVSVLEKFGVISICVLAIYFTRIMSDYWRDKSVSDFYKKKKLRDLGQWGVVVGADKSIGQAYAVEIAKQGLNVVLVGCDLHKLSTLSNVLEKYFEVFAGVISLTFTSNEFKYIQRVLSNLDIAVLINAPDYSEGLSRPEYFLDIPKLDEALSSVVDKNITIVTKMCATVLPGMVSKGKGIIINVSSLASKTSCPLLTLHGASAAYVDKFSEELRNEYSSSGVIVQTLLPGHTTKRSNVKTKSWLVPTPRDYVGSAFRKIGLQGETSGYIPHSVLREAMYTLQVLCPKSTVMLVKKFMESIRDTEGKELASE